jgi:hypothetical protein
MTEVEGNGDLRGAVRAVHRPGDVIDILTRSFVKKLVS